MRSGFVEGIIWIVVACFLGYWQSWFLIVWELGLLAYLIYLGARAIEEATKR